MYDFFEPLLFRLDPENAHSLVKHLLRALNAIFPRALSFLAYRCIVGNEVLGQKLPGLKFNSPVGLAGGFDKDVTMIRPLSAPGFSFLKFGTSVPKAQKGNGKP